MAGIGFELKKVFQEENISKNLGGVGYSTLVTVGPTFIVISTIILLYKVLGYLSVGYADRELLSSTILYAFIFSVIIVSPFNGVMSRFVADKIYEEKYEDILPSFYVGLLITVIVAAIFAIPFALRLVFIGKVSWIFTFASYSLFFTLIIAFYSMTYLYATKNYKIVAGYFVIGMIFSFIIAVALFFIFRAPTINAILYGLTIGFLIISILQFSYIKKYFNKSSNNYLLCLKYFKNQKKIFFSNLFYTLGIYVHNFVFWALAEPTIIAKCYVSIPSYDMASCIAMFSNISAIIIFTVMAETKFHDKYQEYGEKVIGATWREIVKAKRSMFRLLMKQLVYVVAIQAVITATIYLICVTILPKAGFGGMIMVIYPSLTAAFFAIFIMYCSIIYLYYLNDNTGALITSTLFLASVLIGSVIATRLPENLYGIGAFAGATIGWSYSFFRIRYMEKNFDEHIFCEVNIINKKNMKMPSSITYRRKEEI